MKREIKFKVFDKENRKWLGEDEFFITNEDVWAYAADFDNSGPLDMEKHELVQYTELKTTDYKEMYDGDLLRFNDHSYDRTGGNMNDRILVGEVAFSCGTWIVKMKDGHFDLYTLLLNDDEAEVIGNIHDHPHLLGGVDK